MSSQLPAATEHAVCTDKFTWYGDGAGNTVEENYRLLPNLNALVAISKGMWAVKLCSTKSSSS